MPLNLLDVRTVRPSRTHLVIYTGGYGGEFIGYWLSQHPNCVPADALTLKNNRYVHRFNHKFRLSESLAATDELLFLLAHPPGGGFTNTTTFNGIPVDQIQHKSYIDCSQPYRKFFFLLMWIKMRLFKFQFANPSEDCVWPERWSAHVLDQFADERSLNAFREYTGHRPWMYQFEANSFKSNQPNWPVLQRAADEYQYCEMPRSTEYSSFFTINLDELMFGNADQEHEHICKHYGIDYDRAQPLVHEIQAYHQRNLDLFHRYVPDISLEDFINLSHEQAWPLIEQAVLKCHTEPLCLV
jgi:hypothetical protein